MASTTEPATCAAAIVDSAMCHRCQCIPVYNNPQFESKSPRYKKKLIRKQKMSDGPHRTVSHHVSSSQQPFSASSTPNVNLQASGKSVSRSPTGSYDTVDMNVLDSSADGTILNMIVMDTQPHDRDTSSENGANLTNTNESSDNALPVCFLICDNAP